MGKTVVFRADAGVEIGTGHVMRCLTLADMLDEQGAAIFFICRKQAGHLAALIEGRGYRVILISNNQKEDAIETHRALLEIKADWLIIDHYQVNEEWEKQWRPIVKNIMVIDDLANRSHDCDVLLDQNFYENIGERYRGLVPNHCQLFLGPQYLLLRPEFIRAREGLKKRDGNVRHLLIFYGGSDPTNESEKALRVLQSLDLDDIQVDVVTGNANPNRKTLQEQCLEINAAYHCQIDYLSTLMAEADLSLGAGGVAMWERCYLGLPTITTAVAENQRQSVKAAANFGAIEYAGWHGDITETHLSDKLKEAIATPVRLQEMSKQAMRLMGDGRREDVSSLARFIMEEN